VDTFLLVEIMDSWQACLNTVMKLPVPQKAGNLLGM